MANTLQYIYFYLPDFAENIQKVLTCFWGNHTAQLNVAKITGYRLNSTVRTTQHRTLNFENNSLSCLRHFVFDVSFFVLKKM